MEADPKWHYLTIEFVPEGVLYVYKAPCAVYPGTLVVVKVLDLHRAGKVIRCTNVVPANYAVEPIVGIVLDASFFESDPTLIVKRHKQAQGAIRKIDLD